MSIPIWMPAPGKPRAPLFDTSQPKGITSFFRDLEFIFECAHITSDKDKKRHLLRYVDFDTEEMWMCLPEFSNPSSTYGNFKDAILEFYPHPSSNYFDSLNNLDLLVDKYRHLGISSTSDLSDFHLQFITISSWLMKKHLLADLEQKQTYIRAFQLQLLTTIMYQLQIKIPDHYPSIPYEVKDVFDAAEIILQGSGQTQLLAQELYSTLTPIAPIAPAIFPTAQSISATTPSASNLPSTNTVIYAQDL